MTITARSQRASESAEYRPRHPAHAETPEQHHDPESDGEDKTTLWWWVRTVVSWVLLLVMVGILAVMVLIPRLTGSTAYTVLTGSMEPTMPPGTLIVVKPTPNEDLTVGDVITFQPVSGEPAVVTHRIEAIFYTVEGERSIRTRGDANNVADATLLVPEQIRGRVIYAVPYLGQVNSVINGQSRSILITVVASGLAVYAVWMIIGGIRDKRRKVGEDNKSGTGPTTSGPEFGASELPVADPSASTSETN
ncbi:signal peptidase I [Rhodococcus sp. OK302]|uniref:signal peptidase I n=1 Tax=Rhodococcus sp. OK302 TaxID=1882769 RepID=UPI000B9437E1|nr:signal peptidase I [Rhodococcus sp. OK302]OYD66701.1 signal peptidase [Rhodococcus sp. OK302]